MAPSKTGKAAATPKPKKEKLHHPQSRKASQIARKQLRKGKMGSIATKRGKNRNAQLDVYGFFYEAIPEEGELTLDDMHRIISEYWITRYDEEIEAEQALRRKGRPKSTKETKLEELRMREIETYRTGMEVPDLTHPANVALFRRWDEKEAAFIGLLRFIRIFRDQPEIATVSRPGKHLTLLSENGAPTDQFNMDQDLSDALTPPPKVLLPPIAEPSLFSSSMMSMDGPVS